MNAVTKSKIYHLICAFVSLFVCVFAASCVINKYASVAAANNNVYTP